MSKHVQVPIIPRFPPSRRYLNVVLILLLIVVLLLFSVLLATDSVSDVANLTADASYSEVFSFCANVQSIKFRL